MRSWYENLTDGLQQTERGQRVEEAANALEGVSQPSDNDLMSDVEVYHPPSLDMSSRSKRAEEIASMLESVANACHDFVAEHRSSKPETEETESEEAAETEETESETFDDSDYDELDSIADQCENDANEIQNVEFPGMYG
jgi:hypothetical protein